MEAQKVQEPIKFESFRCLRCNIRFIKPAGPQMCHACGSVQVKWDSFKEDKHGKVASRSNTK
jgi:rRNA maturation endonuclease Nob1